VTQPESRKNLVNTMSDVHPKLRKLLETGELDWDNEHHRAAFLKAWVNAPREQGDKNS